MGFSCLHWLLLLTGISSDVMHHSGLLVCSVLFVFLFFLLLLFVSISFFMSFTFTRGAFFFLFLSHHFSPPPTLFPPKLMGIYMLLYFHCYHFFPSSLVPVFVYLLSLLSTALLFFSCAMLSFLFLCLSAVMRLFERQRCRKTLVQHPVTYLWTPGFCLDFRTTPS